MEIDGEQHYVDKRIVSHDIIRTQKLEEMGWSGIRVRWSEFQNLKSEEKEDVIKNIGSVMKWLS